MPGGIPTPGRKAPLSSLELYDSAHQPAAFWKEFRDLARYRDLIFELIARNIKVRYKRSLLGVLWTMVNPLLMMTVLTIVFSGIFRFSMDSYAIYLLSGLIVWNFFSESTAEAMSEMIYSGNLFTRIYVPKTVFAISAVGNGLLNLLFSLVPLLLIMLVTGVQIKATALLIPLPILFVTLIALGVGLTLSTVAMYFADILIIYRVLLTAWMYLTPIIYPLEILPENLQRALQFNPLFYGVEIFRWLLYLDSAPPVSHMLRLATFGLVLFWFGWWIFTKRADEYPFRV